MAAVTAKMVKDLREMTGAGMMDCKKALSATDGDMDKAVEFLREKGLAGAEKKAGRIAAEGIVDTAMAADEKKAVIVEVNSETDFVAKNAKFQAYVAQVAAQALTTTATDMDAFMDEKWTADESLTVKEALSSEISIIGENMSIRRFKQVTEENGFVSSYIHAGGRIGVLLDVQTDVVNDAVKEMAKNVCMQVAALNPKYTNRNEVSADYIEHEKSILMAQIQNDPKEASKPEKVIQGMIQGRINKEMKEICLLDQVYVKAEDGKQSVAQYVAQVAKENSANIEVKALQDDVTNEKEAYDEIHVSLQSNLDLVNVIGQELEEIMALYANIKDRFGLEDWTHRFSLAQIQMEDLSNRRDEIQKELKQNQRPSVDVVHGYRKFSEDVNEFHDQVKDMKEMLVGASSDESRAKKQLTKLQLILNEVRLNTVTRHLPSISSQFSADLKEGERLIQRVRVVLDHSPLDVQTLNADLQDAIDFVYKLYNNANNLVGVAVMVENAIVFGNRFRSTHAQMDSDLTRAELCFQNGEYTRALKIAIQAIENMHPGIYEKLVAQKDPAVMNQVQ